MKHDEWTSNRRLQPMPKMHTYIGYCCREWVLATGHGGRCGLCGEVPEFLREDTDGRD